MSEIKTRKNVFFKSERSSLSEREIMDLIDSVKFSALVRSRPKSFVGLFSIALAAAPVFYAVEYLSGAGIAFREGFPAFWLVAIVLYVGFTCDGSYDYEEKASLSEKHIETLADAEWVSEEERQRLARALRNNGRISVSDFYRAFSERRQAFYAKESEIEECERPAKNEASLSSGGKKLISETRRRTTFES